MSADERCALDLGECETWPLWVVHSGDRWCAGHLEQFVVGAVALRIADSTNYWVGTCPSCNGPTVICVGGIDICLNCATVLSSPPRIAEWFRAHFTGDLP